MLPLTSLAVHTVDSCSVFYSFSWELLSVTSLFPTWSSRRQERNVNTALESASKHSPWHLMLKRSEAWRLPCILWADKVAKPHLSLSSNRTNQSYRRIYVSCFGRSVRNIWCENYRCTLITSHRRKEKKKYTKCCWIVAFSVFSFFLLRWRYLAFFFL